MRYLVLNLIVMGLVLVGLHLFVRRKLLSRRSLYVLLVLVLLTIIFDSVIVQQRIVAYNLDHILGVYIIKAPVEDFAYAVVAALLGPVLWDYYEHKK